MANSNKNTKLKNNYKFALDIGTRTLIGMLLSKEGKNLLVEDYEILEHQDRAMYDGQVHDIDEVSEGIRELKSILEERNQIKLEKVSIAAAGRSLRTERVSLDRKLDPTEEIRQETLDAIEMEAIQVASENIKKRKDSEKTLYYCVGYSIVGTKLDGVEFNNPIGHSASNIEFSLVATFLPHNVSETLYKVVSNAGLSIESLTLEPIAALEVSVKKSLRLLNLAIVDIGAGTSDIALTKNGNIFSYGMVHLAGDEITEALMKKYLLAFEEAEKLKLNLSKESEQEFTDILGNYHKMNSQTIIDDISPALNNIAEKISECILEVNEEIPDAIFMVGGSSQMPSLKNKLAKALKIDENKISLKNSDKLDRVIFRSAKLSSPEFVTPIGIGYIPCFVKQRDFVSIVINSKVYRLFNRNNLSISDALILAGFNAKRLIKTRGQSLNYILNGEEKSIQGSIGEASKILLNGMPVSINASIKHMDMIEITKPVIGKAAEAKLKDVVDFDAYTLIDGKKVDIIKKILVNGVEITDKEYQVKENDTIETIDKDFKNKKQDNYLSSDYEEYDLDEYEEKQYDYEKYKNYENQNEDNKEDDSKVFKKVKSEKDSFKKSLTLIVNNRNLEVDTEKENYSFSDLLNLLNYDLEKYGDGLSLKLNGVEVGSETIINDGDKIDLGFK